ncbi:MAG: pyridoxamine 5'-phosphate oxidase family protein [Spirochaetia bacterium]|nr:pyridoxamine 5'-phosphate oxidase family protein [Spirochaetia bacterium]
MFRRMARIKQQIPDEECIRILKEQKRGVLSVFGDDGYPYGVPLNHWYNEEDGCLYFHGGMQGHKIDALKKCDKVSFCVLDDGYRKEGDWALTFKSVIVFGKVRFVEDHAEALDICRKLSLKFLQDTAEIEAMIQRSGSRVLCFALVPEHMTGKQVHEA